MGRGIDLFTQTILLVDFALMAKFIQVNVTINNRFTAKVISGCVKDTFVICFIYMAPSKSPPRFPNTAEFEIPLRRIKIYSMCVLILMLVRKKIDALAGLTLVLNIAPSNLLRIFKIRKSLATELKKNKNGGAVTLNWRKNLLILTSTKINERQINRRAGTSALAREFAAMIEAGISGLGIDRVQKLTFTNPIQCVNGRSRVC